MLCCYLLLLAIAYPTLRSTIRLLVRSNCGIPARATVKKMAYESDWDSPMSARVAENVLGPTKTSANMIPTDTLWQSHMMADRKTSKT